MNQQEQERRARLLNAAKKRLPSIKEQFEQAQNRNFNSNFKEGGKDAHLVAKAHQNAKKVAKKPAVKATVKATKKAVKATKPVIITIIPPIVAARPAYSIARKDSFNAASSVFPFPNPRANPLKKGLT